jgi:GDP-L-fucose synthase
MELGTGSGLFNVGLGSDVSIKSLAETIMKVVGFKGGLEFDRSKPDGTPRKLLDVSKMADLGWRAKQSLEDGIKDTYAWYLSHQQKSA